MNKLVLIVSAVVSFIMTSIPVGTAVSNSPAVTSKVMVANMYADTVDRYPSLSEIFENTTGKELMDKLIHSEEFKNRNMSEGEIVEFYYKMFLDREATEWDKAFWSERITTDDTTLLFYGVINSETFKNKCEAQGLDAGDYFIESGVFTEGIYNNNPECGLDANGNYIFYATFGDSTYYHVVYNANATTLEYSEA